MSRRKTRKPAPSKRWILLAASTALLIVVGFGAGAQAESKDTFCSSCHTENETIYVERTLRGSPDLATAHSAEGVRCIDCHSGSGVFGRVSAELLGARDALVFATGRDVQPHQVTRHIADVNCLKCHTEVSKESSFEAHYHVFLPRWQHLSSRAAGCVDCHQGHPTNGDPRTALLNREHTLTICQSCHTDAGEA